MFEPCATEERSEAVLSENERPRNHTTITTASREAAAPASRSRLWGRSCRVIQRRSGSPTQKPTVAPRQPPSRSSSAAERGRELGS